MRKLHISEIKRKSAEDFKCSKKLPYVIVLDNIRSLNNVGSFFRTADAFPAEKIYLCGITACPPHNDIRKTALGAEEVANWAYFEDSLQAVLELKKNGYKIIAVEQAEGSTLLQNFQPRKQEKYALVFGNEVKGVQQAIIDRADYCIEIPQEGTKHSLNVSVSAGVVLWHFYNRLSQISPEL